MTEPIKPAERGIFAGGPTDPAVLEATASMMRRLRAQPERLWTLSPATLANHLSEGHWRTAAHLELISSTIASAIHRGLETGKQSFIIISVPPRHGKSRLVSVWSPLWILEHWSWANVMLATYASDLANDFSRETRDLAIEHQEELSFELRSDVRRTERWMTTAGGGMFAVGVGGPITGRGAHVLLLDDYIKNAAEASSPAIRESLYDWFQSTALTRLEPGGVAIVVATRWDEDDLIGRLMKDHSHDWKVIHLPALAEENDPLGRKEGEALWPQRYSKKTLEAIKRRVGTYWWESLYQQKPRKAKAGMFKSGRIEVVQPSQLPPLENMLKTWGWDTAATEEADNPKADWTVGTLYGLDEMIGYQYMLMQVAAQVSPGGVLELMERMAKLTGPDVWHFVEQEPGASGKAWIHSIAKHLKGYTVQGARLTGPKIVKAQSFIADVENGLVKMVDADWNEPFCKEVDDFPEGEHDDRVDSVVIARYGIFERHPRVSATWGRTRGKPADRLVLTRGATFGRTPPSQSKTPRPKLILVSGKG